MLMVFNCHVGVHKVHILSTVVHQHAFYKTTATEYYNYGPEQEDIPGSSQDYYFL